MRHLQILRDYRGKQTHDQLIPVGIYSPNDPLLWGLSNYLVHKGVAAWVGQDDPEPDALPDATEAEVETKPVQTRRPTRRKG